MDDILTLYTEPLPKGEEVHCFDETLKQLLSTPHGKRAQKPGKLCCPDYEYKRNSKNAWAEEIGRFFRRVACKNLL